MTDYTNSTPEERFAAFDSMASQLFGTSRYKTEFARRYGIANTTLTAWSHKGPPQWALVAVRDALAAERLDRLLAIMGEEE